MSGHSKWSTIKRAKGVADIKRGQTFTKVAKAITLAAKLGNSGDPGANPRLRMVLEEAKSVNMPKENINRAIEKGMGAGKEAIEELTYEGFGPGKVAFIVEAVTDNRLRTNQEIKSIFDRNGGNLGGPGSVSYMFDKKGELKVVGKGGSEEDEELELIDLGAEDIEAFEEDEKSKYLVYVESPELNTMGNKCTQSGYTVESQQLVMKPNTFTEIRDKEAVEKVMNFAEKLEDNDDVQKVFANFNIDERLI
jgi:YebC/PmpR family DNA-binding regulatory protein